METTLKTAPTVYPVSLTEIKEHVNIDLLNSDHDNYLRTLIKNGTAEAEKYTGRRFITQTWYGHLDAWPIGDRVYLPYGQLQSVTAITYRDTDESSSTFSSSYYLVNTDSDPGFVSLGYGDSWPTTTLSPSLPIKIEYVCGYGDDAADVPDDVRHAIKTKVADRFEHRENAVIGGGITVTSDLKIFESLLWPYKIFV